MAYLDTSALGGETRSTAIDAVRFSTTELRVIDFAERVDATREIAPESRLGRFIERVLGTRLARPLADQRLESLRRFVSLARHHAAEVTESEIGKVIAAGFSPGQAYGLFAYLTRQKLIH